MDWSKYGECSCDDSRAGRPRAVFVPTCISTSAISVRSSITVCRDVEMCMAQIELDDIITASETREPGKVFLPVLCDLDDTILQLRTSK